MKHMSKYFLVAVAYSTPSYAMQQVNPMEKILDQQARHEQAEQCAQDLRDYIDRDILNIDTNGFFRAAVGKYYSAARGESLVTQDQIIAEINKIESRIPSTVDRELVVTKLRIKHSLFNHLIERIVVAQVNRLETVDGHNIDYISNSQRIIPEGLSSSISSLVKMEVLQSYKFKHGLYKHLPIVPFNKNDEIHYVPLIGHKTSIDISHDKLLISHDNRYLKAIDYLGGVVVWDMERGDLADEVSGNIVWSRLKEDNHHCNAQRVLNQDGTYLATPGLAWAFGTDEMHMIINKINSNYRSVPVIVLFKRPTIESHLCQQAFIRSKGNLSVLIALRDSQSVEQLTGFPAINLKNMIDQEIEKLTGQSAKL